MEESDTIDNICKLISSLSVGEKKELFNEKLGIVPKGFLYAYRIPLYDVQVSIWRESRRADEPDLFNYNSKRGEWVLVNMGMTTKRTLSKRLNYFDKFRSKIKPVVKPSKQLYSKDNLDMMYSLATDTSYESSLRRCCFLGGFDVGGNTARGRGYFSKVEGWNKFLLKKRASPGFTELVIIPNAAFARIKKLSTTHVYPFIAHFEQQVASIIIEETLRLLGDDHRVLSRASYQSVSLLRWKGDSGGDEVQRPWDHSEYLKKK